MRRTSAWLFLVVIGGLGCSSEPPADSAGKPAATTNRAQPAPDGTADAGPAPLPQGPRQGDGERPAPVRPAMDDYIKDFLQNHVFCTGGPTVRVEVPPQRGGDPTRIFWFNPVNITRDKRYGSDATFVTDGSRQHYSPGDLEKLNDGNTRLVMPFGVAHPHVSGGSRVQLNPGDCAAFGGVRVMTTLAWVDGYAGLADFDKNLGYILFVNHTFKGREHHLRIWYTGPLRRSPPLAVDAEIVICPLNEPAVLRANAVLEVAVNAHAKAVVPVGMGDSQADTAIVELERMCAVPLWVAPSELPLN